MTKFIKSIVFFVLICCFSYCIFILIWGKYAPEFIAGNLLYKKGSNSFMYTRLKEAENYGKTDVLFLGSSHTYRGFDTRIFEKHGIRSFNLGSSAQTPLQTNLLLKRYLHKLNPAVIIYEVYPRTFCSDGIESSLDIIANNTNDFETFKMVVKQNNLKGYNTFLYGMMNDFINGNSFVEKSKMGDNIYVKGGYLTKKINYYNASIKQEQKSWEFNNKQLIAFNENICLIKSKKVKLILVEAPFTHSLFSSYTNNDVFDKMINNYGEYYNYNKLLNLNDSLHFDDEDHLNQSGVNIFNEALIEQLFKK